MRQALVAVLAVAITVATFALVLPRIADYGDVWDVLQTLAWTEMALLAAATAVNLATFALPLMAALPGIRFRRAFQVTQASTASTYIVPGGAAVGIAVSFAMLRRHGFSGESASLALAVTGAWNQLALLASPTVALGFLALTGEADPALRSIAFVAVVIFVVVLGAFVAGLSSATLARRVGDAAARVASWARRLVRRGPVTWDGDSFVRFRDRTNSLLARRWHVLTLATLAAQLSGYLLLLVSLRVLDVPGDDVSAVEAFAAWSLARLLASIPVTPGGVGVVELGLTTALVGFGGGRAEVVAVVLVYRALTLLPTLVIGLLAGVTWRRQTRGSVQTEAAAGTER
jgi:uncharacterized protein (TIRG00374 family)